MKRPGSGWIGAALSALIILAASTGAGSSAEPGPGRGYFGFQAKLDRQDGRAALRVDAVLADGPAQAAGLVVGDRIVEIDGVPVAFESDLQASRSLGRFKAGDRVELGLHTERGPRRLSLVLMPFPEPRLAELRQRHSRPAGCGSGGGSPAAPAPGQVIHSTDGSTSVLLTAEWEGALRKIRATAERSGRLVVRKTEGGSSAHLHLPGEPPLQLSLDSLPPIPRLDVDALEAPADLAYEVRLTADRPLAFQVVRLDP